MGGLNTVRGYENRVVLGDAGVLGTIELRSPILKGSLWRIIRNISEEEALDEDRLQFIAFADGARMFLKDPLPEEEDDFSLLSLGVGVRTRFTKYSQVKLDWGYPLEETGLQDSNSSRIDFSFELQL